MCKNNRDGELPSCLAAKYDGPGCEEWDLCYQCADTLKAEKDKLVLQIDAWKRYHALLSEELDSAVGMAYIHGWRSTDEKIALGKKLRAELGLPDNEIEAAIKERTDLKPIGEGPTSRPCCVEAYNRGFEMGSANPRTVTDKRKDEHHLPKDKRNGCVDFGHKGPIGRVIEGGAQTIRCENCDERVG